MDTTKVDSYRKRLHRERLENQRLRTMLFVLSFVSTVCMVGCIFCVRNTATITSKYLTLAANFEELDNEHTTLLAEYAETQEELTIAENCSSYYYNYSVELEDTVTALYEIVADMEEQNTSLVASNQEYYELVQAYEEREELFDKYEYAIIRTDGTRTDITYDQLITLEEVAEEKDVDVDLVLAIAMVESSGTETASNSSSSARGYGQFLYSTAKFTYEKLMSAGTYSHSLAYDGTTNLTMMVYYLDYLSDQCSGNLYSSLRAYRGEGGSVLTSYIAKIDSYLKQSNTSVASLNAS